MTNLDVHRDRKRHSILEDRVSIPRGKVPFGTTKCTFNLGLDLDAKLTRNTLGFKTQTFPRNPTDNISSEPPAVERNFQNLYDQMATNAKYAKNEKSSNPWGPRKVTSISQNWKNRNSVAHDIITNGNNKFAPKLEQSERISIHTVGRFRGISEFNDLSRLTARNHNPDHNMALTQNAGVFKRKDGIFTHLYNSAARFGENQVFKA